MCLLRSVTPAMAGTVGTSGMELSGHMSRPNLIAYQPYRDGQSTPPGPQCELCRLPYRWGRRRAVRARSVAAQPSGPGAPSPHGRTVRNSRIRAALWANHVGVGIGDGLQRPLPPRHLDHHDPIWTTIPTSPQDRLKPAAANCVQAGPRSAASRWRQRLGHLAVATSAVPVTSMNGGH